MLAQSMSLDVLYLKVVTDSLSRGIFLRDATSAHSVKYLFLGIKNISLFSNCLAKTVF